MINAEIIKSPYFRQEDILSLCQYSEDESFKGVDILMASDWPQGVSDYATPPVSDEGVLGVVLIDGRGFDILPGAWKEKSVNSYWLKCMSRWLYFIGRFE